MYLSRFFPSEDSLTFTLLLCAYQFKAGGEGAGGGRAWGGDFIVIVVPGMGLLTDLATLGRGYLNLSSPECRLQNLLHVLICGRELPHFYIAVYYGMDHVLARNSTGQSSSLDVLFLRRQLLSRFSYEPGNLVSMLSLWYFYFASFYLRSFSCFCFCFS